jgi:hypothetical protein
MVKYVIVSRIFDKDTVRDTLSTEMDALRAQGYSIFGVNEYEKFPGTVGTRWARIFYE